MNGKQINNKLNTRQQRSRATFNNLNLDTSNLYTFAVTSRCLTYGQRMRLIFAHCSAE